MTRAFRRTLLALLVEVASGRAMPAQLFGLAFVQTVEIQRNQAQSGETMRRCDL